MSIAYHLLRILAFIFAAFACSFLPLPYFIVGFVVASLMTWLISGSEGPGFWWSLFIVITTFISWPVVLFEMGFELYRVSRVKE